MAGAGKPSTDAEIAQRRAVSRLPRPNRTKPDKNTAAKAALPGESLDQATLRLQIARADTEELDRQKRELELQKAKGLLVTKEEAVDLAQAALLRAAQVFDLVPERLRDKLPPSDHHICELLENIIREARVEVANV